MKKKKKLKRKDYFHLETLFFNRIVKRKEKKKTSISGSKFVCNTIT